MDYFERYVCKEIKENLMHSVILIKEMSPDVHHHVYDRSFYTQPMIVTDETETEVTLAYNSKTMKGLRATFNKRYIEK